MTHRVIKRRMVERSLMIAAAEGWAEHLAERLDVVAAVVFGSVARGDFNKWSDIDVLVVAADLPPDARRRLEVLMADAPPGLQLLGWTPEELSQRRHRKDPVIQECEAVGVTVYGELPS